MSSAFQGRSSVDVTLTLSCGEQSHDVAIEVTAWGSVRTLFNPCDCLPQAALNLSKSDCVRQLATVARQASGLMQDLWLDDDAFLESSLAVENDLDALVLEFAAYVRENKNAIAASILANTGSQVAEDALLSHVPPDAEDRQWATLVCALTMENEVLRSHARTLMGVATDWSAGLRVPLLLCTSDAPISVRLDLIERCIFDQCVSDSHRSMLIRELGAVGDLHHGMTLVKLLRQQHHVGSLMSTSVDALQQIIFRTADDPQPTANLTDLLGQLLGLARRWKLVAEMLATCSDYVFDELLEIARCADDLRVRGMAVRTLSLLPCRSPGRH